MRSYPRGVELLRPLVGPKTIIDVGVAEGTPDLYRHFPSQRYLLVEASPDYTEDLDSLAKSLDAVVEKVFCGRESGAVKFRVYSDPHKSSRYQAAGETLVDEVTVPVETLDDLVSKHRLPTPYLLKVDVEGAELDVIAGAGRTLASTEAVIAEVSVAPRFNDAPGFADIVAVMDGHGFSVFDILAGKDFPEPGRLYTVDLVFVRSDAAFRAAAESPGQGSGS
jgi:FkbM family methyltransferase